MAEAFLTVLNISITASWLVLAIIILRFLLKKLPKSLVVVMWALVGIRLLIPFSVESPFSLLPSTQAVPANILAWDELMENDTSSDGANQGMSVGTGKEILMGTNEGQTSGENIGTSTGQSTGVVPGMGNQEGIGTQPSTGVVSNIGDKIGDENDVTANPENHTGTGEILNAGTDEVSGSETGMAGTAEEESANSVRKMISVWSLWCIPIVGKIKIRSLLQF